MQFEEIISELESLSNPEEVEGRARFGINHTKTYGVRMPELRRIAKAAGKDHVLAEKLWNAGYGETKILAGLIEDPKMVTESQMENWVAGFDSWDVCDQCCINLFRKTPFAYKKVFEWSTREEEFVKRAAFAMIAVLAVHDKKADDEKFEKFFPLIIRESVDNRNFVKKAVNWALRQIGKRNLNLNKRTVEIAEEISTIDSKSAKWIAADAIRELTSEKVHERLKKK
ncbi:MULTISPECIES: DNA alkylation repair protein [Methanobacterium]|jgi:3-methyladenine DNA glycosylase AlkD|uniref:DNA alkylation repair protein n=1 Tax=Methanobacterium bryantii TaxID=2161 RepID=A0A2A2H131_METBR|nr:MULTISPECIES: DNA alkylation repair protein [Methanobacterium]OEC88609.1 DNA alkylation repair protein [Methanobacterium sp. A39]PAV02993.1 DNA alkylation repair protein [Methanobacterium bryantii]